MKTSVEREMRLEAPHVISRVLQSTTDACIH